MDPFLLGKRYDKIAQWWHDYHVASDYGVKQVQRAANFMQTGGTVLDVGCGSGGRLVRILEDRGFAITGIDVSEEMVKLATKNHPEHTFVHGDICLWATPLKFDFIVAWDSIFHLPLAMQKTVISKLCRLLAENGILIYTFGNDEGEHLDEWQEETFYYSSIGINENVQLLLNNGLSILHLELDQYPQKHVYTIATKAEPS